jgi:hypothetical protein
MIPDLIPGDQLWGYKHKSNKLGATSLVRNVRVHVSTAVFTQKRDDLLFKIARADEFRPPYHPLWRFANRAHRDYWATFLILTGPTVVQSVRKDRFEVSCYAKRGVLLSSTYSQACSINYFHGWY